MNTEKIKKAYNTLRKIDSENDLKKNKLTLSDYQATKEIFFELSEGSKAETFIKAVADFYQKCGFVVKQGTISYTIQP